MINEVDNKIINLRKEFNNLTESSITIKRKASSGATVDGLNKRRLDLLERINEDLSLNENNLLEFSNLETQEDFF